MVRIQFSSAWQFAGAIALGLILGLGALHLFGLIARPLGLFLFGITLASALSPLVDFLTRRVARPLAIMLVYLALLLIIILIGLIIFPPLIDQFQQAIMRLPDILSALQVWLNQLEAIRGLPNVSLGDAVFTQLGSLAASLVTVPVAVGSRFLDIGLVLFISLYALFEAPGMRRFLLSLFPSGQQAQAEDVIGSMLQAMGGYVRGAVLNGLVVGTVTTIGLSIIGVDFPLVLGLLAGILELIPAVGPVISGILIVIVALVKSPTLALISAIFMVVMQQVENHILVPNIMRSQTDVPPLLVIVAVFAGASIGGLLGALLAIPVAAALSVLVKRVLAPAIRAHTGASEVVEADQETDT